MTQTNSQRQAAFRIRHSTTKSRINVLVSNETKANLSRLAQSIRATESAMIALLVHVASRKLS